MSLKSSKTSETHSGATKILTDLAAIVIFTWFSVEILFEPNIIEKFYLNIALPAFCAALVFVAFYIDIKSPPPKFGLLVLISDAFLWLCIALMLVVNFLPALINRSEYKYEFMLFAYFSFGANLVSSILVDKYARGQGAAMGATKRSDPDV